MDKLKVCTLFSGYDSQCMALDRIGIDYDLVAWAEIDKYAIMAHNAVYPQWADRNLGDVSQIDWSKVGDIDLLTYSSPCITEDSLVLTYEGYKQYKDVVIGDYVLTNENRWRKVVKKFDNGVKQTVVINALGCENIRCTPNHKFYVREMKRIGHKSVRTLLDPSYVEASALKTNHYLGIPINSDISGIEWSGVKDNRWGHARITEKLSCLFYNKSFWYLMGRYVGDGWSRNDILGRPNGIVVCCGGRNRKELEDAILKCGFKASAVDERTVTKYQISSIELASFVSRFGKYAYGKKIDGETLAFDIEMQSSFLDGILDSDGCYTQNHWKVSTVSRELAYGISYLVNRVYRRPCRIYNIKRNPKYIIEGRTVNQRNSYEVVFTKESRKQDHSFVEDNFIWYPIKSIVAAEETNVYDMEVEEDHSYCIQGAICHNCQDFSQAGLQRGGQEGSGTRSSLLWECRRAIEAKKPKYLLMENVAALVSQKFIKTFQAWQFQLEQLGYTSFSKVLNAKDYGVPQNRERIFCVSIRDCDRHYYFPEPIELTKCLKDVMEKQVDEKYYLSEKALSGLLVHNENHEKKGTGFM